MKKEIYYFIVMFFLSSIAFSQAPDKMNYQAIVRDAAGNILANQQVGLKISILKGTISGTVVFEETHAISTNTNGLITLVIGSGTVVSGNFSAINWSNDSYFLKTETDPTGGTSYTISGASPLLSVPYALYAKSAGITYKVGDVAHGGIVFWVDETGKHGLVCSKTTLSSTSKWRASTFGNTQAKGDGIYAGKNNTAIIIAAQVAIGDDGSSYAARLCNEYVSIDKNTSIAGWYLPSKYELNLIYQNRTVINAAALTAGGSALLSAVYWSSTEVDNNLAWAYDFSNGQASSILKTFQNNVRAVKSF
jgi:hypothetical protein